MLVFYKRGRCYVFSWFVIKLSRYKNVIVFKYRFGGSEWSDCCYNPHMSPTIETEDNYTIIIILIDSSDGKIVSLCTCTLSTYFSSALNIAIKEEQSKAFREDVYLKSVNDL